MVNHDRCKQLVKAVENLSKTEIEELFKMIHKKTANYTRNNNGMFLNLTRMDDEILGKLEDYVQFCNRSQTELLKFESICDVLNVKSKTYMQQILDEKEKAHCDDVLPDDIEPEPDKMYKAAAALKLSTSTTSSARYATLKKRFSKQCVDPNSQLVKNTQNDLKQDPYVIYI
jgi:hypothetical protein